MSLQAILEAVHTSGSAQVYAIEMQALSEVQDILAKARVEAQQIQAANCAAVAAPALKERARIIHRARQESLCIIGRARETLVEAALEQIHERLTDVRKDAAYPEVLCKLTLEALDELGETSAESGNVLIDADPRDQRFLEEILSHFGLDMNVQYNLACWGGLITKSEDQRVVVINTLEVRFERAIPYLRRSLSALFEDEGLEVEVDQTHQRIFN